MVVLTKIKLEVSVPMLESKTAQRRRRNPTTAPGRGNHSRVPFSRHPAQSVVMTGAGSLSV